MAKSKNVVTIKEGWDHSLKAAEKSSEIMRQMALGGIAVIWLFKIQTADGNQIPQSLILPVALFAGALLFDLLQVVTKSELWRIATRRKQDAKQDEFTVTPWIGWTVDTLYWIKMILMLVGYGILIWFLMGNLLYPIPIVQPPSTDIRTEAGVEHTN